MKDENVVGAFIFLVVAVTITMAFIVGRYEGQKQCDVTSMQEIIDECNAVIHKANAQLAKCHVSLYRINESDEIWPMNSSDQDTIPSPPKTS